jgi:hypothetical protein
LRLLADTDRPISNYFFKSLLWLAIFAAVTEAIAFVVSLIFTDFIHGNPNRSHENSVSMMMVFPLLFGVIAIVGVCFVFSPSQAIQACMLKLLHRRYGRAAYIVLVLALPLVSIVTWYCYDYLTPSDINLGINQGSNWIPYQHGLTVTRYLLTLAFQSAATTFSIMYFDAGVRNRSKKPLLVGVVALTLIAGTVLGYRHAVNQYGFLNHPSLKS